MPWARIDDSLYDHPKLDALGPSRLPCVGLNTLALSWSNHWLTDGFIPADRVRKLGGTAALADKLVAAGLWERVGEDYRIHDFEEYNETRETVLSERASARERMRNRRRNAGGEFASRSPDVLPRVRTNTNRSSGDVRPPRPVPSLPDHTRPVPSSIAPSENGAETTANFRSKMTDLGVKG